MVRERGNGEHTVITVAHHQHLVVVGNTRISGGGDRTPTSPSPRKLSPNPNARRMSTSPVSPNNTIRAVVVAWPPVTVRPAQDNKDNGQ